VTPDEKCAEIGRLTPRYKGFQLVNSSCSFQQNGTESEATKFKTRRLLKLREIQQHASKFLSVGFINMTVIEFINPIPK